MPYKPKAGVVLLFKARSEKENNNWRSNGHRWYQGRGGRWILNGLVQRRVFNIVTPNSGRTGLTDFQMFSWTHNDKKLYTLVQFVGNDELSVDFPHKNSKKGIPYIRTAPSVLRDLEVTKEKPYRRYQQDTMNAKPDATTQNLLCPRNVSQVRNAKQRFKKTCSGTDHLTNLIRLSLQYEDIRFLNVAPDLIMVSISPFMLEQARAILKIDYDTARLDINSQNMNARNTPVTRATIRQLKEDTLPHINSQDTKA